MDDYWKVESSTHLSDSWRGFTKFILLKEKLPKGYMWSGEKIDKDSNDYQTRSCMARSMDENWQSRSESRKTRWAKEKPKLDNARRKLRGTYLIDPNDQERAQRNSQEPKKKKGFTSMTQ